MRFSWLKWSNGKKIVPTILSSGWKEELSFLLSPNCCRTAQNIKEDYFSWKWPTSVIWWSSSPTAWHFKPDKNLKRVIKDIVQMPLKNLQAWGILFNSVFFLYLVSEHISAHAVPSSWNLYYFTQNFLSFLCILNVEFLFSKFISF